MAPSSRSNHDRLTGKIRLKLNEGLTDWVARERRLCTIGPFCARQARFGPMQAWTIKADLIGIKGVGKVQHSGAAGIPAIWRADPGFPPSKANDDKLLVFMILKCCSGHAGWKDAFRDTTALQEGVVFEMGTVTARLPFATKGSRAG
jgi:hypothetical protein